MLCIVQCVDSRNVSDSGRLSLVRLCIAQCIDSGCMSSTHRYGNIFQFAEAVGGKLPVLYFILTAKRSCANAARVTRVRHALRQGLDAQSCSRRQAS